MTKLWPAGATRKQRIGKAGMGPGMAVAGGDVLVLLSWDCKNWDTRFAGACKGPGTDAVPPN